MKNPIKKMTAIITSISIAFLIGVPVSATEETEPETPAISQEELLEFIQSEEVKDSLEENGIDINDVEEEIENGDYIIIENEEDIDKILNEEEIEALRKEQALLPLEDVWQSFLSCLTGLVLLPAVPVMLIVPVFGWVTAGAALVSPILLIATPFRFVIACFKSIDIYLNFDPSEYQSFCI